MRRWIGTMLAAAMLTPVLAEAQRSPEGRREGPRTEAGGTGSDGADRMMRRGPDLRPDREWRQQRPRDRDRDRDWRAERGGRDVARPDAVPPLPDANRLDRGRFDQRRPDGGDAGRERGRDGAREGNRDWRSERRADDRFDDRPDARLDERRRRGDDGVWRSERPRDGRFDSDARRRPLFDGRRDPDRRFGWGNRGGDWGGDRGTWGDRRRWDRDWRADSRYDWSRYRGLNRNAFHLPRYYAPGGWAGGYRRFGVGVMLSPGLWAPDYWIGDPFAYRLPEAYGPYRWVRYYNDALLVDIDSGQVVDMVYDIFW